MHYDQHIQTFHLEKDAGTPSQIAITTVQPMGTNNGTHIMHNWPI